MNVIVPLAGPDFETENGLKPETDIDGKPLIQAVLNSRAWAQIAKNKIEYIFLLQDTKVARRFYQDKLSHWFSGSQAVFIPHYTQGAALSALMGVSLLKDFDKTPVCVDLADIIYTCEIEPVDFFKQDDHLGALLPVFNSQEPHYSYAVLDAQGYVSETVEKKVVSSKASAGTYFFRNGQIYIAALAAAMADSTDHTYAGLHYVCPVMNGVLRMGSTVRTFEVTDVVDVKN